MRFIWMIAIAICIMAGSPAMAADPIDNTDEFIQKMAHEGDSQESDETPQSENNSPIEWGDDSSGSGERTGVEPESEESSGDKGLPREAHGK